MNATGGISLAAANSMREAARCVDRQALAIAANPMKLLLFSVGGVRFGIDADQVAGIAAYQGGGGEDLHWFHEELDYGGKPVSYQAPTVVTIRTGTEQSYRLIIDALEDIADVGQNDLVLFPPVVETYSLRWGLWGIWLRHGQMIFLLDIQRLLKERLVSCAVSSLHKL